MAKNYLPFARRVYLTVPIAARRTTLRESFSSGLGQRAFLSDVSFDFVVDVGAAGTTYNYNWVTARVGTQYATLRMGIFGKPFLTEEFYPVATFNDSAVEEAGVWRLAKPYTLFPGERLKARILYSPGGAVAPLPSVAYNAYWATWPSIAFHGIRRDNKRPIVLYDTFPSTFDRQGAFTNPPLGTPVVLQGERLQCPKETPIDIYAVKQSQGGSLGVDQAMATAGNSIPAVQIFGPDGRKWWENDNWPAILQPTFAIKNLRNPEWVLEPSETVQFEVENAAFEGMIMITLRGQIEVNV